MCGRYSIFLPTEDLEDRFDATAVEPLEPRYNAAPGQSLPVITNEESDTIQRLEWGLLPHWADDESDANRPINARAETVAQKPTFREAYEQRRCLVLADGFYEWTDTDDGRQPYRIALDGDDPFAMAGLWERFTPKTKQTGLDAFGTADGPSGDTEPIETFTIITTEPNDLVGALHDRMAVILDPEEERQWLAGTDTDALLDPYPASAMRAYPVSTAVNSPANDSPELVEPIDEGA